MENIESKEKFIGFVDVLGFKNLVEAAESGAGISLPELMEILKYLGTADDSKRYKKNGPMTCPQSTYIQRDLNFRITQASDCVIVSSEVSPAGLINLISHCWKAVLNLLLKGIMCRGYITKGLIYHNEENFIGSGYQKACSKEKEVTAFKRKADEKGTPFVEVDPVVCGYVEQFGDECVKKMFSRFIKSDGEVTALYPSKMLAHSFMFAGPGIEFDAKKEKRSNNTLRLSIEKLKEAVKKYVDYSNDDAIRKSEHYIKALDDQLAHCNKVDKSIDKLSPIFSTE